MAVECHRVAQRRRDKAAGLMEVPVTIELDHIILAVNEQARSVEFYTRILGLEHDGDSGPFSTLRVTPGFVILIAPWGTKGGEHLAFAMSKREFDDVFERVIEAGIPYGDRYDLVGNMKGPGDEEGSRGMGKSIYFFDPDRHLVEIRHYDVAQCEEASKTS
jgi:catechol 2,3-dioxygenase-like lactoylglutathione lyase family enzyme